MLCIIDSLVVNSSLHCPFFTPAMVEFEPIGAGVGENEADVDEKLDWGDYAQRTLGLAAAQMC